MAGAGLPRRAAWKLPEPVAVKCPAGAGEPRPGQSQLRSNYTHCNPKEGACRISIHLHHSTLTELLRRAGPITLGPDGGRFLERLLVRKVLSSFFHGRALTTDIQNILSFV